MIRITYAALEIISNYLLADVAPFLWELERRNFVET